jgi:hypothetical protein
VYAREALVKTKIEIPDKCHAHSRSMFARREIRQYLENSLYAQLRDLDKTSLGLR